MSSLLLLPVFMTSIGIFNHHHHHPMITIATTTATWVVSLQLGGLGGVVLPSPSLKSHSTEPGVNCFWFLITTLRVRFLFISFCNFLTRSPQIRLNPPQEQVNKRPWWAELNRPGSRHRAPRKSSASTRHSVSSLRNAHSLHISALSM